MENLMIAEETAFVLTFDDVLVRNEWSVLPSISCKQLKAEADLEVLDFCSDLGINATLFIPAVVAIRFPDAVKNLSDRHFDIGAHGYYHENLKNLSLNEQIRLIALSKKSIEAVIRREVAGWRSPGLHLDLNTLIAIQHSEISWCSNIVLPSWLKQYPFGDYGEKVEIPISQTLDYNYFREGFPADEISEFWFRDLQKIRSRGANEIFTLLVHPWLYVGSKKSMAIIKKFLQVVASSDNIRFLTCSDICKLYTSNFFQRNAFFNEVLLKVFTRARASLAMKGTLWGALRYMLEFSRAVHRWHRVRVSEEGARRVTRA